MKRKPSPIERHTKNSRPVDGSEAKIGQIAQALRSVRACIPRTENAIPFTATIPGAAREIYLSWRQPEAKTVKPSQWRSRFQKKATQLSDLLRDMPADLVMDVFQGVAHKSDFHRSLNIAIAKSTLAPKREGGRRGNLEARRLAITVGNFYFNLSGRPPTVTRYNLMVDDPISEIERHTKSGGEFFNLLAMIFRILGVKDDPRTAAEFVRDNWPAIDKVPGSTRGVTGIVRSKVRTRKHP